jgi:serine/threonine protein phosphatase PrpC
LVSEESAPPAGTTEAAAGPVEVRLHGRTDVGLIREHNEDSFVIVRLEDGTRDVDKLATHTLGPRGTLLVVCDGMGGAAAGEVASGMAIEALATTMLDEHMVDAPDGVVEDERHHLGRKLRGAARDANAKIFREARENLARSGMGTTMTALHLWRDSALIAQVGDSRAYVWRQGAFTQVTRDQSLVNQLLETGQITVEQAKFFEHSNVILQALGVQEEVEVQLSKVELRRGDRMMLCSDGLVGVVSDEEIGAVVGSIDDPAEAARILIEMANGAGGPDNVTVIVAHVDGNGIPEATLADALTFGHWRIDPEPPPLEAGAGSETYDGFGAPASSPTTEHRVVASPSASSHAARKPTMELMSMAVVIGLILGGIVTGAALYRHGVRCRVAARQPGLAVLSDGHDTGARTGESSVELRLPQGHHVMSLRANGAPPIADREVQVEPGQMCEVSFGEPASR